MEAAGMGATSQFFDCMKDYLGDEITPESVKRLSDEEMVRVINEFKIDNTNNPLDFELLWIQMKLLGFADIDNRKENILLLCGEDNQSSNIPENDKNDEIETNDAEQEEVADHSVTEEASVVEKKKNKPKKLTAEEKAAKNKAAVEKKEIGKKQDNLPQKDDEMTDKPDETDEMGSDIEEKHMNVEELKKQLEDDLVSKYVGIIRIIQNYYNFNPIGKIENGEYIAFSQSELDVILPKSQKCNINLYYSPWDDNQTKFMDGRFYDGQAVILNAEIDDLEENRQPDGTLNPTGYKIPAIDGCKKDIIKMPSDIGFYRLLSKENLMDDYQSKKTVRLNCEGIIEGEKVLINLEDGFYAGPFVIKYSSINAMFYINMQAIDGKHFASGYTSSSCERIIIEPNDDKEIEYRIGGYNSWIYYKIKEGSQEKLRDFISDKDLLDSFKSAIEQSKELDYTDLDVDGIVGKLGASQIIGEDIPEEIRKQRIERITKIMSSEEDLKRMSDESSDLIVELILKNKDNERIGKLLSEVFSKNPSLIDKMQGIRAVQAKVESVRAELDQLEAQKNVLESEVKKIREGRVDFQDRKVDTEELLTADLAEKKAELDSLMEKIKDASKVSELQDKIEKLKDEAEYYEKHKAHLQNDTKGLESKFVELINGYSEKVADVTFDGFMSSKMLQAASSWEKKEEIDELARRVTTLNVMDKDTMDKDELVDYIVRTVQILRPSYSKNTIVNILTCVSQGFLTVFSGMPGCGKTSICNIISRVLGLNNYERVSAELKNVSRYIQVSVERGWTSKRDFIGYYNPLTKAFEESNREVYDALQLLDMESRSDYRKWPFFILLDEANLSPMEYYWADFMNVCDDLRDNSFINLGNDNIFKIPETLHFLATINNDHTTETLSPRLIDRAWIISLPKVNELHSNIDIPEDQIKPISWEELMTTFSYADEERKTFDRESQAIFDGIKDKLAKQELYLSPRVRIAIERYWLVASRIMEEDEYGNSSSVIALDYAISQKILPKLIGSGDEYEAFLEDLKKYCDEKNLSYTTELLTSMINRGNRQMKYYQFFN
jgi:hypothetical protein